MSDHAIVHLELSTKDPAASAKFYKEIFGWKIEVDPQFNYHQFMPSTGPGGGFVQVDDQMYKTGDVVPYIGTDDIDATLKQIESHGGKTVLPKTEITNTGWFAFFLDPSGNRVGLYKSMRQEGQ